MLGKTVGPELPWILYISYDRLCVIVDSGFYCIWFLWGCLNENLWHGDVGCDSKCWYSI